MRRLQFVSFERLDLARKEGWCFENKTVRLEMEELEYFVIRDTLASSTHSVTEKRILLHCDGNVIPVHRVIP